MKAITKHDIALPESDALADTEPTPACSYCGGAGYYLLDVPFGHKDFGILQLCDCKRREQERKRAMQAREAAAMLDKELGQRYHHADFESFNPDWPEREQHRKLLAAVLKFCQSYAAAPQGWLLLHGKGGGMCGSGKSHLAAAIARATDQGAAYATVPDLFNYILSDWGRAEQRIEALASIHLLVMDDMGQEAVSGRGVAQFREKFFRVLNSRDRRNLPTVITSNYTLDELGAMEHYSEAVISRMYGQTEGQRIMMNVPDYRRKGAK